MQTTETVSNAFYTENIVLYGGKHNPGYHGFLFISTGGK